MERWWKMRSYRIKRILTGIAIISCCSGNVLGAEYYIAGTGCDDSYAGTEAQPWCSIQRSIGKLIAGDTLYVKNGTYVNVYLTGKSGTASQPITVKAYPGHAPVIQGSGYSTGGRNRFTDCNYFVFDGFTVTNMNQGVFIESSHDFTLQNSMIYNIGQEGVHVRINSHHVTLKSNVIHDTGKGTSNGEGIYVGTSSSGPSDNTNNVLAVNNTVYNTTDEGIELKPGTSTCVVDNNTFYNTGNYAAIEVNQNEIPGVQLFDGNPGHVVRNNTIHDISANGATAAIRAGTGSTVYNNVVYNIAGEKYGIVSDMLIPDSYARRIYHNTIDVPGSRALFIDDGAPTDSRNNIGPGTAGNIATSDAFYVNKAGRDYHLASGSAPVDAGVDLAGSVPFDRDGRSRPIGPAPDLGAYEYPGDTPVKVPKPPSDVRIIDE
jgi:hypothetical protein